MEKDFLCPLHLTGPHTTIKHHIQPAPSGQSSRHSLVNLYTKVQSRASALIACRTSRISLREYPLFAILIHLKHRPSLAHHIVSSTICCTIQASYTEPPIYNMTSDSFRNSLNGLGWSRRDADIPANTSSTNPLLSKISSLNPFKQGGYVQLPTHESPGAPLPAPTRREEEEAWFACKFQR